MANSPFDLNALQRIGMAINNPQDYIKYQKQNALAQLAADQGFQKATPDEKAGRIAQITGDPADVEKASALSSLAQTIPTLDMSDPIGATNTLAAKGLANPDAGVQMALNPNMMFSGMMNSMSKPALSQVPPQDQQGNQPSPQNAPLSTPQTSKPGRDEAFLASLPPAIALHVKAISDGNEDLPVGSEAKDIFWKMVSTAALRYDPSLQRQTAGARAKTAADFAGGKAAQEVTQGNSVMGHLYDLHESAPGLDLTGHGDAMPAVNWLANKAKGIVGLPGNQALQQYNAILTRAAPELNKFYVGGEGDKEGRAQAGDTFSPNQPVNVIQNNVRTQLGLLQSKLGALQTRKDEGMGRATSPVLSPRAQALMDDLQGKPLTSAQKLIINAHRKESQLPAKTWDTTPAPPQSKEGKTVRNSRTGQIAVIKNGVPVPVGGV